jgi:hypothetical protein
VQRKVEECYEFLAHHLIPHAQAEEHALHPVVGKVLGASEATATMSRDHVEVGRLTEELGTLHTSANAAALSLAGEADALYTAREKRCLQRVTVVSPVTKVAARRCSSCQAGSERVGWPAWVTKRTTRISVYGRFDDTCDL